MYPRAFPNILCISIRFFRFSRGIVKGAFSVGFQEEKQGICSYKKRPSFGNDSPLIITLWERVLQLACFFLFLLYPFFGYKGEFLIPFLSELTDKRLLQEFV